MPNITRIFFAALWVILFSCWMGSNVILMFTLAIHLMEMIASVIRDSGRPLGLLYYWGVFVVVPWTVANLTGAEFLTVVDWWQTVLLSWVAYIKYIK